MISAMLWTCAAIALAIVIAGLVFIRYMLILRKLHRAAFPQDSRD